MCGEGSVHGLQGARCAAIARRRIPRVGLAGRCASRTHGFTARFSSLRARNAPETHPTPTCRRSKWSRNYRSALSSSTAATIQGFPARPASFESHRKTVLFDGMAGSRQSCPQRLPRRDTLANSLLHSPATNRRPSRSSSFGQEAHRGLRFGRLWLGSGHDRHRLRLFFRLLNREPSPKLCITRADERLSIPIPIPAGK